MSSGATRKLAGNYHFVMTHLPGPDSQFVELENDDGQSINPGEWVSIDGLHHLVVPIYTEQTEIVRALRAERDIWRGHTEAAIEDFHAERQAKEELQLELARAKEALERIAKLEGTAGQEFHRYNKQGWRETMSVFANGIARDFLAETEKVK